MRYFNDFKAYQSTLSITGVRGTLARRFVNSELSGKFLEKLELFQMFLHYLAFYIKMKSQ